jgi:hypothetical protein
MPEPDRFGWLMSERQLLHFERRSAESQVGVLARPALVRGERHGGTAIASAVVGIPNVASPRSRGTRPFLQLADYTVKWNAARAAGVGDRTATLSGNAVFRPSCRMWTTSGISPGWRLHDHVACSLRTTTDIPSWPRVRERCVQSFLTRRRLQTKRGAI